MNLAEANARIDFMIHIAGAVTDPEALPEQLTDFIDDCFGGTDTGELAIMLWPWMKDRIVNGVDADDEAEDNAIIGAKLYGFPGYLIHASTPVMQRTSDGRAFYSWGYVSTAYLYAATEAEIEGVVSAWAETRHKEDLEFAE